MGVVVGVRVGGRDGDVEGVEGSLVLTLPVLADIQHPQVHTDRSFTTSNLRWRKY